MTASMHGGVVFRVHDELYFLPASIAMKVLPVPEMAIVPGGPVELCGVALVDGDMIPVVDVSDPPVLSDRPERRELRPRRAGAMLVCTVLGERVGFVGLDVVATGRYEVDATGAVRLGHETAYAFDVAGMIARVREGRWAV